MATMNEKKQAVLPLPAAPGGEDVRQRLSKLAQVKRQLAAEPKVRIRLMQDEVVIKNGYGVQIQAKQWVEVPESIALILEQAGRM